MKKTDLINIFLIPVIIISCAGTQTNETKEPVSHIKAESDSIIKTIKEFNSKSPSTVSSSIQVDAVIKNKKYKSSGTAVFDSDSAGINIVLQDYVFKSPIFQLFQEGSKLYIYFPAEKQLIIDNSEVSNLGSYSEIEIDYAVLRSLGRGEIPLIKNYKIKQAVSNPEKKENIIILENDSFYQTIYLADKLPLKMLFANKKTNERIEIYFNKIYNDD
jgi:hypothetical protein